MLAGEIVDGGQLEDVVTGGRLTGSAAGEKKRGGWWERMIRSGSLGSAYGRGTQVMLYWREDF